MAARGVYVDVAGVRQAAVAPRMSGTAIMMPQAPGAPGAETETVLETLGYDADAIRALRASGALT